MKTIRIIQVLVFVLLFGTHSEAQVPVTDAAVLDEISVAIRTGDANKIAPHLNNNVELVISGKNNVYNKNQAAGILADFFKKNSVKTFAVTHKSNKPGASFLIGTLKSDNNTYRVYVLTRKQNNKLLIQQLRIENE